MQQQQSGIVLACDSQEAQVRIVQHSACASCGKCSMGHEERTRIVTARNLVAARPGDRVILSMSQQAVLQAGLLAYTIPLLGMFLGVFLGQNFAGQIGSVIGGFGALAGTYLVMHRFLEPRLQKATKFTINITQIIDDKEANCCVTDDHCHH